MKTSRIHSLASVLLLIVWLAGESIARKQDKAKRLKFITRPKMFYSVPFGSNFKIDCTTNDPYATTALYHSRSGPWNLRSPTPGKLFKSGQVYTILDFAIPDAGQYKCKATDASGTTIKWLEPFYLIPNPNLVPPLNIDPVHAVVLTTGQSRNVTCSSVSSSTLRWFKKLSDGTEVAVPSGKVYSERNSGLNKLKLVLMFKNVQKSEAGTYVCEMRYQGRRRNFKYSELRVYEPFRFKRQPKRFIVVAFGDNLPLDCTTTEPDANVTLYFKNSTSPWKRVVSHMKKVFKNGQTFTVTKFGISDIGNYQCRATSRGKRIQWNHGYGIVIASPNLTPAVRLTPRHSVVLTEGQSRNITCSSVDGTTLEWFKEDGHGNNVRVPKSTTAKERGQNEYSVVLMLRNVSTSDSGSYKCLMTFRGRRNRIYTWITVKERFKFLAKPQKFYAVPMLSNFSLNCTTNHPASATELYHRGTPLSLLSTWKLLSQSAGKLVKSGQVYTILDFGIRDAGQYKCKATDASGTTIRWARPVTLIANPNLVPPLNIEPMHAVVLTTGQSRNVTCSSVSSSTLRWFKKLSDGTEVAVPSGKVYSERKSGLNKLKLVLMFKNVQKSEAGTYICKMRYQGRRNLKYTVLEVYEPAAPKLMASSGTPLLATPSANQTLQCTARGFPRPHIKWYKDGKQIAIRGCRILPLNQFCKDNKYKLSFYPITKYTEARGSLTLYDVNFPADQGRYTCVAFNSEGKAETNIDVQSKGSKPHLKGRKKTLSVNESSSVVLSCSATGFPLPNITWYKGSNLIGCLNDGKPCGPVRQYKLISKVKTKQNVQIVRSKLRIAQTNRARDQGKYVCVASNRNGVAKRLYQLDVN